MSSPSVAPPSTDWTSPKPPPVSPWGKYKVECLGTGRFTFSTDQTSAEDSRSPRSSQESKRSPSESKPDPRSSLVKSASLASVESSRSRSYSNESRTSQQSYPSIIQDPKPRSGLVKSLSSASVESRPGSRMSSFYNGYQDNNDSSLLERRGNNDSTHSLTERRGLEDSPALADIPYNLLLKSSSSASLSDIHSPRGGLMRSGSTASLQAALQRSGSTASLQAALNRSGSSASLHNSLQGSGSSASLQSDLHPETPRSRHHRLNKSSSNTSLQSVTTSPRLQSHPETRCTTQCECGTDCLNLIHQAKKSSSPGLANFAQAIRDLDKSYNPLDNSGCHDNGGSLAEEETVSEYDAEYEEYQEMPEYQGFGASLDYASFRQKKKQRVDIVTLFPTLPDNELVSIEAILEVWSEKGLNSPIDSDVHEFLKELDPKNTGQLAVRILSQNLESVLLDSQQESPAVKSAAMIAFKSTINHLKDQLSERAHEKRALEAASCRLKEDADNVMREYEEMREYEARKAEDNLRLTEEQFQSERIQLEKEGEEKREKLRLQMENHIKRLEADKEKLKCDEAELKKQLTDLQMDLKLTRKEVADHERREKRYDKELEMFRQEQEQIIKRCKFAEDKVKESESMGVTNHELKNIQEGLEEENKSLKDEKDELLQKMDAYKGELEKSKKKMRKYKKLAESKGTPENDGLMVAESTRPARHSVNPIMSGRQFKPRPASPDEDLETSLNDELARTDEMRLEDLEDRNNELEGYLEDQNQEIRIYAKKIHELEDELNMLRGTDYEGTDCEADGRDGKEKQLTRAQFEEKAAALQQETEQALQCKDEEFTKTTLALEELEHVHTELQTMYTECQEVVEVLKSEIEEHKLQSQQSDVLEGLDEELASFKEQVQLLNGALQLNIVEIETLEEQLVENGKIVEHYETELAKSQELCDELRQRSEESGEEKIKDQCTERQAELVALHDRSIVSGDLIKRLQSTVEELTVELTQTKQCLEESEGEVVRVREELKAELTQTKQCLDETEGQLTSTRQSLEESEGEAGRVREELSSELVQTKLSLEQVEGQVKLLREAETKAGRFRQEVGEEAERGVEEVGRLRQEVEEKEEEVEELKENVHALEVELQSSVPHTEYTQQCNIELGQHVEQLTVYLQAAKEDIEDKSSQILSQEQMMVQESERFEHQRLELSDQLAQTQNDLRGFSEEMQHKTKQLFEDKKGLQRTLKEKEEEIESLNDHIMRVEKDYEGLVESLNRETDDRVSELHSKLELQLQDTAGISHSLKSQLHELGQQFIALTTDKDKVKKENVKVRSENELLGQENQKLCQENDEVLEQIEELESSRTTMELDIKQHVAEYQDMMKVCATLQEEKQEFVSNLSELEAALADSGTALLRAVSEKSEIIHIFEEKVKEKERLLNKTQSRKESLVTVKDELELQLAVAIRSLDELTERYEVENSILEEKVIEVINESKEKEVEVLSNVEVKIKEHKEVMYNEFGKELGNIKKQHEDGIRAKDEETSVAMTEFKKKCEKKVVQIKEKFKVQQNTKDEAIKQAKEQLVVLKQAKEGEIANLRSMFEKEKDYLVNNLSHEKQSVLESITTLADQRVQQLETTHGRERALYEEKVCTLTADLSRVKDQCDKDVKELTSRKDSLQAQLSTLQTELQQSVKEAEQRNKEVLAIQTELKQLEKASVREREEMERVMRDEVSNCEARYEQKEEELRQSTALELQGLREQFEIEKEGVERRSREEIEKYEEIITELQNEGYENSTQHNEALERMRVEVGKVQEELETLTTEHREEKEGLERQVECLLQDTLREKDQHIVEVIKYQEDLCDKENTVNTLTTQLEHEKTCYEEQFSAMQQHSVNEAAHHIAELRKHEEQVEEVRVTARAEVEEVRETARAESGRLEEALRAQESTLVEEKLKSNKAKQELEGRLGEKERVLKDVQAKYREELEERCTEKSSVSSENSGLQKRLKLLTATLRSEQAVIEERVRQVEELKQVKHQLQEKLGQRESELKKEVTTSVAQRRLQQELEDQSREELISHYKALQLDLEARLDNVVIEHSSCHLMKRKMSSLKQQLAIEKTARNPNTETEHKLELEISQNKSLHLQVNNLKESNKRLEDTIGQLWEEKSDLVEKVNNSQHQVHLALQESLKSKGQKAEAMEILKSVVNTVTLAAGAA